MKEPLEKEEEEDDVFGTDVSAEVFVGGCIWLQTSVGIELVSLQMHRSG